MDLSELADYTALKKLAASLWQQDSSFHGAAIFIGAGFSRGSAVTGDNSRKLPLWNDLSLQLAKDIDAISASDPLRLAEEYEAYFGTHALHELIYTEVNDMGWSPGRSHFELLKLPWSEVLTTNWDTLLERAARELTQPVYTVVNKQQDLSSSRRPRIVKLHGTIGVSAQLTFTQEDYRKYTSDNAAFVNFARQAFIENELCLLGFSGDDPNFLQWAGWVRDHLNNHARKIYLVGCLSLTPSKRKYLETINVSPIDLSDLVSTYDDINVKHSKANEIFIQALSELRPKKLWEWQPSVGKIPSLTKENALKQESNGDQAAKLIESKLPDLVKERVSYPNWQVCPGELRSLLLSVTRPSPSPQILSKLSDLKKDELLYEMAWRHSVTLEPVPNWLIEHLLETIDFEKPKTISNKQKLEIAVLILKNCRWLDDPECSRAKSLATEAVNNHSAHFNESKCWLLYLQALEARDQFDFSLLEKVLQDIDANNAEWMLRKAALLSEIGLFEDSKYLIDQANRELLSQYRNDRYSIHILSRLAWAQWIRRASELGSSNFETDELSFDFKIKKCEPWDFINHLERNISSESKRNSASQGVTPSFEPGRYRDHSKTVFFGNNTHPLIQMENLVAEIGIPLRWKSVSLLIDPAKKIHDLLDDAREEQQALSIRIANSETSESIQRSFSRIAVANLSDVSAHNLFYRSISAIKYWSDKYRLGTPDQKWVAPTKLRIFIEVLARLVVRVNADMAKEAFSLAMKLGERNEIAHPWITPSLGHLIDYSIRSVPKFRQKYLLTEALRFPLTHELSKQLPNCWPNPVIEFPGAREINPQTDSRISSIIEAIDNRRATSQDAIARLAPLVDSGFLTKGELEQIASRLWDHLPEGQVLPNVGLRSFAFAILPSKQPEAVKRRIRDKLYEIEDSSAYRPEHLDDILGASRLKDNSLAPNVEQAKRLFNALTDWRPDDRGIDIPFFSDDSDVTLLVGEALSYSIVPSLEQADINDHNFDRLYALYENVGPVSLAGAFVCFAGLSDSHEDQVERVIRLGLQSRDTNEVSYAANALVQWCATSESDTPRKLATKMIYLVESGKKIGLSSLIRSARKLIIEKELSSEGRYTLMECLPSIFESTDYARIEPDSREAISVSVVRAEIIKVSKELCRLNDGEISDSLKSIIEAGERDPLPEVRFASL